MKFKNISLYLLTLTLILSVCGCGNKENEADNNGGITQNNERVTQSENMDYSKYIGTYSITSDEGTKYESKQTLTIKSLDGKTLDFEYELQPYRHTITITAEQGVFSSKTTAEATGTYNIDGQIMPYGFEFRFNDNSIDLKCGFADELNEQEYITFYLDSNNASSSDGSSNSENMNNGSNNKNSKEIKMNYQPQLIVTSKGEYNQYTEPCKKGMGRQFVMTMDEFIEQYNAFARKQQEKRKNGLGMKDDHIKYYQIDKNSAETKEERILNDEVIAYTFGKMCQDDAGIGDFDGAYLDACVLCYKDTDKILAVYCQVSDTWYEWDSEDAIPKAANGKITNEGSYDNITHDFQLAAYRMFSIVNRELISFNYYGEENRYIISDIFTAVGTENINYMNGINYSYYSFSRQDTEYHGLFMYTTDEEFAKRNKNLKITI